MENSKPLYIQKIYSYILVKLKNCNLKAKAYYILLLKYVKISL